LLDQWSKSDSHVRLEFTMGDKLNKLLAASSLI